MPRIKQRITQICILIAIVATLISLRSGPIYGIVAVIAFALSGLVYRRIMRYLRRCKHCGSGNVLREHVRPYQSHPLKQVYECETYKTCRDPLCVYRGKPELEKAYTKEFGTVHKRLLHFAGLL